MLVYRRYRATFSMRNRKRCRLQCGAAFWSRSSFRLEKWNGDKAHNHSSFYFSAINRKIILQPALGKMSSVSWFYNLTKA